ncbi:MAG TPA: sigma-70 family RNA polymerase sigma factor [Gemmatimonadaceae bacterium]|jgi:RNA polymerase sigma-70 factor (ECF subfamily)
MLTDLDEPETAIAAMPSLPPDRDAERALVTRAQQGDVGAFEMLYHQNAGRVYALALRLTGNRENAGELTQDVFVAAWQRLTTFRGDAAFASWLHRIAVNTMFMRARGDRRRVSRIRPAAEYDPEDESSFDIDRGQVPAVDVEQAVDLERAIAALPAGARRVFVLHDVLGYRHDEIARLTGLAAGTLRAQLHRARRLLMEALDR